MLVDVAESSFTDDRWYRRSLHPKKKPKVYVYTLYLRVLSQMHVTEHRWYRWGSLAIVALSIVAVIYTPQQSADAGLFSKARLSFSFWTEFTSSSHGQADLMINLVGCSRHLKSPVGLFLIVLQYLAQVPFDIRNLMVCLMKNALIFNHMQGL